MAKCQAVLDRAVKMAADYGVAVDQVESVEVVGGSSRVPWVKRMVSATFGGKECSRTMNEDESVARGCALQAAILSPLYKVRDFKVEDTTASPVSLSWMGSAADAEAGKAEDGDLQMVGAEGEQKTATLFEANSPTNILKMITFNRKGPFEIKAQYADGSALIKGTPLELGTYKINLPAQSEPKKVKVRAKLDIHGTFAIESAQLVEEETYEEKVKEKRELPEEAGAANVEQSPVADDASKKEDEAMPQAAEKENGGENLPDGETAKTEEKPVK